jgi:hypothetical protein
MTSFNENDHPRDAAGTFADKAQTNPEVSLSSAPALRSIDVQALALIRAGQARISPWGGWVSLPGQKHSTPVNQFVVNHLVTAGLIHADRDRYNADQYSASLTASGAASIAGRPDPKILPTALANRLRVLALVSEEPFDIHYGGERPAETWWRGTTPGEGPEPKVQPRTALALIRSGLLETSPSGNGWERLGVTEQGGAQLAGHPEFSDREAAEAIVRQEHRIGFWQYALGGKSWGRASTSYGCATKCSCGHESRSNEGRSGAIASAAHHIVVETDRRLSEASS